jgi:hypothetical protein
VQAWRIDENNLAALLRHDTLNAISRSLRLGSNDGDLLTDQLIDQRGLASVGSADNGNKAGAVAAVILDLIIL